MTLNIYINNLLFFFNKQYNILQAAALQNINIPRFCFHEKLSIAGNCRLCLVEVKGVMKPIAACALPITNNMVIFTETKLVKAAREGILEFILINHPLDCPICDQGGECDLQDQVMLYGNDFGRFYDYKKTFFNKNFNIFIKVIMTRCIYCTRCVRFNNEISGNKSLGVTGRGQNMKITNFLTKILNSELSGNIIDLCPVGALTSKIYSFKARPWELTSLNTINLLDPYNLNIRIDLRDISILRILPRFNTLLKEYWLTDVLRYSFDGFINNRVLYPYFLENKKYVSTSWIKILYILKKNVQKKKINFLLGNFLDAESLIYLKKAINRFGNFSIQTLNNIYMCNNDFKNNFFFNFNLENLKDIDILILINLNLRLENPLLNIKVKNLINKNLLKVFNFGSVYNYNLKSYNLGNNYKNLLNMISGKYFLNNILLNKKNILVICNTSMKNFFKNDFFFNHLISIFIKFNVNFYYTFMETCLTNLLFYNFNLNNIINNFDDLSKKQIKMNSEILYNLNSDSLYFYNIENFFKIYQGSHYNFDNAKYDILLPSSNFFERVGSFFNFFGIIQKTKIILQSLNLVKNDYNILKIFFNSLLNLNLSLNIKFFFKKYNFMNTLSLVKYFLNFNFLTICNMNVIYKFTNIYSKNAILKSSIHMLFRIKELHKIYTNFS